MQPALLGKLSTLLRGSVLDPGHPQGSCPPSPGNPDGRGASPGQHRGSFHRPELPRGGVDTFPADAFPENPLPRGSPFRPSDTLTAARAAVAICSPTATPLGTFLLAEAGVVAA